MNGGFLAIAFHAAVDGGSGDLQLAALIHDGFVERLADLLCEEHQVIRAVAGPLLELVARARAQSLDAAGWKSLRTLSLELADRLGSHARMEEDALVPVVDEILDDNTDLEIWTAHVN